MKLIGIYPKKFSKYGVVGHGHYAGGQGCHRDLDKLGKTGLMGI